MIDTPRPNLGNGARFEMAIDRILPNTMELPRVNPIGIIESPDSYEVSPRELPIALRLVAAAILITFTAVGTITTVVSLGAYCLTSHAGTPSPLQGNR